jgi:hypothetical protein
MLVGARRSSATCARNRQPRQHAWPARSAVLVLPAGRCPHQLAAGIAAGGPTCATMAAAARTGTCRVGGAVCGTATRSAARLARAFARTGASMVIVLRRDAHSSARRARVQFGRSRRHARGGSSQPEPGRPLLAWRGSARPAIPAERGRRLDHRRRSGRRRAARLVSTAPRAHRLSAAGAGTRRSRRPSWCEPSGIRPASPAICAVRSRQLIPINRSWI